MKNRQNVKVIDVKYAPVLKGKVTIQRGIRTMESAALWGAKQGVKTVYWIKALEKVYACKEDTVSDQAKTLEKKSSSLLKVSESELQ